MVTNIFIVFWLVFVIIFCHYEAWVDEKPHTWHERVSQQKIRVAQTLKTGLQISPEKQTCHYTSNS